MTIEAGEREIDTGEKLKEIEEKERMATEKLSEIINAFEEDNQQLLHDHELLKEDHEHLQVSLNFFYNSAFSECTIRRKSGSSNISSSELNPKNQKPRRSWQELYRG